MRGRATGIIARWRGHFLIPTAVCAFLLVGGALRFFAGSGAGTTVWMVGLALTGLPVVWRTLRQMLRGHFATDVVAMLAVATAVVMQQPIAGLVIVLMQSGGEALEQYAEGRASAAVRALERDAPRTAHRVTGRDAQTEDVEVGAIALGDLILVRPGEMVPCDGVVEAGSSHVDTALAARPYARRGVPLPHREIRVRRAGARG